MSADIIRQTIDALSPLITERMGAEHIRERLQDVQRSLRAALAAPVAPADLNTQAMDRVAIDHAHSMALELECILYEYSGEWYDRALATLEKYRTAMREIHEADSQTFMGEPLVANKCHGRFDDNCNYTAVCGKFCNKCGQIHSGHTSKNCPACLAPVAQGELPRLSDEHRKQLLLIADDLATNNKDKALAKSLRVIVKAAIASTAGKVPPLAEDHKGMRVNYKGMLANARRSMSGSGGYKFMLEELEHHISSMGEAYYKGNTAIIDEFLQLYCVAQEARTAIRATGEKA